MQRWTFVDEDGDLPDWTFDMNPSRVDSEDVEELVEAAPRAPDGSIADRAAQPPPMDWTWDAVIYTLAELDTLEAWLDNGRPILLTDHRGRAYRIQLQTVDLTRAGTRLHPEKHKATVRVLMLGRVS